MFINLQAKPTRWLSGKESTYQSRSCGFSYWVRKISWRRKCNPLQYSCLGNPIDRGAWRVQSMGGSQKRHDLETEQQLEFSHEPVSND